MGNPEALDLVFLVIEDVNPEAAFGVHAVDPIDQGLMAGEDDFQEGDHAGDAERVENAHADGEQQPDNQGLAVRLKVVERTYKVRQSSFRTSLFGHSSIS